jgi:hypothetical protein
MAVMTDQSHDEAHQPATMSVAASLMVVIGCVPVVVPAGVVVLRRPRVLVDRRFDGAGVVGGVLMVGHALASLLTTRWSTPWPPARCWAWDSASVARARTRVEVRLQVAEVALAEAA